MVAKGVAEADYRICSRKESGETLTSVQGAEGRGIPRQSREAGKSGGERGVSSLALDPGDAKKEGSGKPNAVGGVNLVGTVSKE